jgi:hypothetical protein
VGGFALLMYCLKWREMNEWVSAWSRDGLIVIKLFHYHFILFNFFPPIVT